MGFQIERMDLFRFALLLLLIAFAYSLYEKSREIPFNYLEKPVNDEIYLSKYGPDSLSVYSSSPRSCSLCGKAVALQAGLNELGAVDCPGGVELECGSRKLWFRTSEEYSFPAEAEKTRSRPYPLWLLLSGALAVGLGIILIRKVTVAGVAIGLGLVSSALVFQFQFGALGVPWVVPLLLGGAIAYSRTRNFRITAPSIDSRWALSLAFLFLAYIGLVGILAGNMDIWAPYYHRQADLALENMSPFYYDGLSYLGRPGTYPPAFFNLAASVGGLLGAPDFSSFRELFQLPLIFVFALTTYLVFHRFSRLSATLATLLIILQWFIAITVTALPLHTFAYIMLNLSLIAPLPLAPIFLGVAFGTHPITLFIYPLYLYTSRRFKLDLKATVLVPVLAVIVSLVFYVPIFLRSGLPYEIVPTRWGYFFTYGLDGMRFEFLFFFPLLLLCLALFFRKGFRLPATIFAFFAFLDAFVLYRVNVIITFFFAGLFSLGFEKELGERTNLLLLSLFILANLLLIPVIHSGTRDWCTWGVANDMCISPMEYISSHSYQNESVVLNPLYAHLEAYAGKRPVLADLYVEYADLGKFEAEDEFYYTGNLTKALFYNVTLAVEDEIVWPPRPGRKNLTIEDGDRVYDNGFMHITRLRR